MTKVFTWKKQTAAKVVFEGDCKRKTGGNETAGWLRAVLKYDGQMEVLK